MQTIDPLQVKLSDVGLARTLSTSAYYRKTSDDKVRACVFARFVKSLTLHCSIQVPVKWMSPEAVSERKYSSKSDVWSYGVFAWEVFSLGAKPYPDMGAHAVITAVARGYRMPRPDMCPPDVYVAHVLSHVRLIHSSFTQI